MVAACFSQRFNKGAGGGGVAQGSGLRGSGGEGSIGHILGRAQALIQGYTGNWKTWGCIIGGHWTSGPAPHSGLPTPRPSTPCSTCCASQPEELISPLRLTLATPQWTLLWLWDTGKVSLRYTGQTGCCRWGDHRGYMEHFSSMSDASSKSIHIRKHLSATVYLAQARARPGSQGASSVLGVTVSVTETMMGDTQALRGPKEAVAPYQDGWGLGRASWDLRWRRMV